MSLVITHNPSYAYYSFTSNWVAAHNPIVFKISNTKFPTNTEDTADSYTAVTDYYGKASFDLDSFVNIDVYLNGLYVSITGGIYEGTYRVVKYVPITADLILDTPYIGNDFSGTIKPYYSNYVNSAKVYAGIPDTHQHYLLKPMGYKETITEIPDSDNVTTFDVHQPVANDVNTDNDRGLISLPNDINLWTAFNIAKNESYDVPIGSSPYDWYPVSAVSNYNDYIRLALTTNDIAVGDYVQLTSSNSRYRNAVIRVIQKDYATDDIIIDAPYEAVNITAVTFYDITFTRLESTYNEIVDFYYAANSALPPGSPFGSNLAEFVNTFDTTVDSAYNLSAFERQTKFVDYDFDFSAIIDKSLVDGLAANEVPAIRVKQYDINGDLLSTQYSYGDNEGEGLYRFII